MDILSFLVLIRTLLYLAHLGEIKAFGHMGWQDSDGIHYLIIIYLPFKTRDSFSGKWHIGGIHGFDFQVCMLCKHIAHDPFVFLRGQSACRVYEHSSSLQERDACLEKARLDDSLVSDIRESPESV